MQQLIGPRALGSFTYKGRTTVARCTLDNKQWTLQWRWNMVQWTSVLSVKGIDWHASQFIAVGNLVDSFPHHSVRAAVFDSPSAKSKCHKWSSMDSLHNLLRSTMTIDRHLTLSTSMVAGNCHRWAQQYTTYCGGHCLIYDSSIASLLPHLQCALPVLS